MTAARTIRRGTRRKAAEPLGRPYQKSGPEPGWDQPSVSHQEDLGWALWAVGSHSRF